MDLLVAATALYHHASLPSHDTDFARTAGPTLDAH